MRSDGTAHRPVVHVRDAAGVVAEILHADRSRVGGNVLNVGASSENHRVRDLAAAVAEQFRGCPIDQTTDGHDERTYRVSFARLDELLGPDTCASPIERGINDLEQHLCAARFTDEQYRSSAFRRVGRLRVLLADERLDPRLTWRN
jgi:nucleoside-diphosphate-sugar epimerase